MILDFWEGYIIPYLFAPLDVVIRILFDRMVSASIIVSMLYGIVLLLRNIFSKSTPYVRYYLWAIFFTTFFFWSCPKLLKFMRVAPPKLQNVND